MNFKKSVAEGRTKQEDGTSGTMLPDNSGLLDDNIGESTFYSLDWLFGDKDPRFAASIAYPGFNINGTPAYFHASCTDNAAADLAGVPRVAPNQNKIRSALAVYKTANLSTPVVIQDLGDNNYMILRLGEIYLNFAEAAYAVGQTDDALTAVNAIRTRAGLQELSSVDLDDIKQERKVELCFENHHFWDLRRWREAEIPLSKQYLGINFIWDVENDTYAIVKKDAENITRLFKPQDYYLPIPLSDIQNNDALIQNPGFEL